jgi:hypothetical protein
VNTQRVLVREAAGYATEFSVAVLLGTSASFVMIFVYFRASPVQKRPKLDWAFMGGQPANLRASDSFHFIGVY